MDYVVDVRAMEPKHRIKKDPLPDYVQTVVVKGLEKILLLPKALDLDRPKRSRTAFAKWQLDALEATFTSNPYLVGEQRTSLAHRLGLSETQIKVWYQNRRTKQRKEGSPPGPAETFPSNSQPVVAPVESPLSIDRRERETLHWQPPSSDHQHHPLGSHPVALSAGAFFDSTSATMAFHYHSNVYRQLFQSSYTRHEDAGNSQTTGSAINQTVNSSADRRVF